MKINGLEAIGEETGCKSYMGADPRDLVPQRAIGPEFARFWWRDIHSGSEAIEGAREILRSPEVLHTGTMDAQVLFICSELIFRVTGEQVTPDGFSWWGYKLDCGVCGFNFEDDEQTK